MNGECDAGDNSGVVFCVFGKDLANLGTYDDTSIEDFWQ